MVAGRLPVCHATGDSEPGQTAGEPLATAPGSGAQPESEALSASAQWRLGVTG
jgi:hypothetical protein